MENNLDLEMIRVGRATESSLIILLNFSFDRIKKIPKIKDLVKNYFINDIKNIYITNSEELAKGEYGQALHVKK